MTISEKIKHSAANEVRIYLEGSFWIAYEQSAYWFFLHKGYKPTKKFVKCLGQEVVSVGFPKKTVVLENFIKDNKDIKDIKDITVINDTAKIIFLEEDISLPEFEAWKNSIELRTDEVLPPSRQTVSPAAAAETSIVERIRSFPLENKTPMECMMFLAELRNGYL
jgi:hypothetical protein